MSAVAIKLYVAEREPKLAELQQLIDAAAREAGVEAATEIVTVRNDDEARTLKSLGSPTIRVNGFDIEYAEREPPETTAGTRYYSTPAGWQAMPEQGMIVFAIREALARAARR
jgi:hypothetical protein